VRWALATGRWTLIIRGVYGRGPERPSELDIGRATALITGGVAIDRLAGALHGFDGVNVWAPEVAVPRSFSGRRDGLRRASTMPTDVVVIGQVRCLPAAETLRTLAAILDDDTWEQALEFCLRKRHVTREQVAGWTNTNTVAARRVRRVIKSRGGLDVPHTDSVLETLAIQLIRREGLPEPVRQYRVFDPDTGRLVARLDLAWPELGIFVELDGQQHKDQPVYDARRQTLVTAIKRWQCGRLTWDDVVVDPESGARQLGLLLRPVGSLVP
jgi:hypothetical protein